MPFVWSHKKKKQARVLVFSKSRERLVRGLPDKGRTKVRFLPPNNQILLSSDQLANEMRVAFGR